MELELGLKITRTREDVSSSVDFRFSKDPFGPLVLSRETDSRFIIIIHLKGFKKEGIEIEINEEGNRITIRGRKPVEEMVLIRWMAWKREVELRAFRKVFLIPDIVDLDKIKARFDDDDATLTITMPKRVKGISGFKLEQEEEEEEEEEYGDVSEAETIEETQNREEVQEENVEREECDDHSENQREEEFGEMMEDKERESQIFEGEEEDFIEGLDEEETRVEDDDLEKIQQIDEQDKILEFAEKETVGQQELAESNTESEDSRLRKLPDITESEGTESRAVEEIEEQEHDELDRTSKNRETEKKTTDGADDGLSKAQGIEDTERQSEESKIQEMVAEETGGQEMKKNGTMEIKNKDAKEEFDGKMGEGFTPNIERTGVVAETETNADEFESEKPEADEVDKKHELVESNEGEEGENDNVRSLTKDGSLLKLQANEEKEPDDQLDRTSKGRATEKKTTDDGGDGLSKVQGIEEPERQSEGSKTQYMVEGKGGQEKKKIVRREIKNGDAKEDVDAKIGEGFTPNIDRTHVVGEDDVGETETKSEEFVSDKQDAEEVDKKHELVEKKEEEEENAKVRRKSEDRSLTKLQENEEQHSKGRNRRDKQESIKELVVEKTPEAETNTANDIPKPIQETEAPEVDTLVKTPEKKKSVNLEVKNRDAKEEVDAKMGAEAKPEDFGSDKLETDEVEKIHELVEKKKEEEEEKIAKVGTQSEDISLTKPQEIEEQQSQAKKRHNKHEKIKELVNEETPEAETNIGNDTPKPVQERCEGKHKTQKLFEEEAKKQPEEHKEKKVNDAAPRKVEEIVRQQELDDSAMYENESKPGESVEGKTNDEVKDEKETKEQESYRPKILEEQDTIQELAEEKTDFLKSGDISRKDADNQQRASDAKEEVDAEMGEGYTPNIGETETKAKEFESDKLEPDEVDEMHELVEKKEEEEEKENAKVRRQSEDRSLIKLQENETQHTKGHKRQEKTPETKTNIPKPVQETKVPEVDTSGETGDEGKEGKEKKKSVTEIKDGYPKEDVDAKNGKGFATNSAKTKTKPAEFESDDVDEIHELVEKKEEEEDNAKVRRKIEDSSLYKKLQETEEQQSQAQKRHDTPEVIKELVEEKTPLAETNIANQIPKPAQETEKPEVDTSETSEDNEFAETETKEQGSFRPKILEGEDKIQELAEDKMNFSRKVEEEKETTEKKTKTGDDDMSKKDKIQEFLLEENVSDSGEGIVAETIDVSDRSRKSQEIDEQQPHEEDKLGNQFQKLIGGETSGHGEVEDVENEKKTTEADKRFRDSAREAQDIERQDSDVSTKYGKGDTFQKLQENRTTYQNEQEEEKEDEADRPEKVRGTIEKELVNLNSQDNVEDGEETRELFEDKTTDCKEEESETKTDDVIRKVQGIKEEELFEPKMDHVSKIKEVVEEKIAESEIEAARGGLSKVHGTEEQELHEPKIHKERDKNKINGTEEPSGHEKVVESMTKTEKENSTNAREGRPGKPKSHEKQDNVREPVESGHNDHNEDQKDENLIVKAKRETEEDSSKKFQEIEKQESDGSNESIEQDRIQESEEKEITRAMQEKEIVERTKNEDGSLRKLQDDADPELSKPYKRQEEDRIQEPVETGTSDYREKVNKPNLDEIERHGEQRNIPQLVNEEKVEKIADTRGELEDDNSGKFHEFEEPKSYDDWTQEEREKVKNLVKEEAPDLKHTGGEGHDDHKEEKVSLKEEVKAEEDSSEKVQEIEKQESNEFQRSLVQDMMQETEEKGKTRATEENKILEGRKKPEDGSLRKVREGEDPELGRDKRREEEDRIQELAETDTSDQREKLKKKDKDDILRSQDTGKLDLGELERYRKERKIHQPVEDEKGEEKMEDISEPGGQKEGDSSGKFHEFQTKKTYEDCRQEDSEEIEDLVKAEAAGQEDKHTGGKGEREEERFEKVPQANTKVEDELNKKVGENKNEEENLVDDSTTKIQETETEESHESEIHEKLDIVQGLVEDETRDQEDERGGEAAAVVANNEKFHSIKGEEVEEHKEQDEIPETSNPRVKEEDGERVAEKETREQEAHAQEVEGKTENFKDDDGKVRRGEKGKQGKTVETKSDDGIVRNIGDTSVEPEEKIEELEREKTSNHEVELVTEDDSLRKGQEFLENESSNVSKRGPVEQEKIQQLKEVGIREDDDKSVKETKTKADKSRKFEMQELDESEEKEEVKKIRKPMEEETNAREKGNEKTAEEEMQAKKDQEPVVEMADREIEEMERKSEDVSSRKVRKVKAEESDGLEKHRKLNEIQDNQPVEEKIQEHGEEKEVNVGGGYKAVLKTKSMEDSSQSQDVEEKGSDPTERYAEHGKIQELMVEEERKEEYDIREGEQNEKVTRNPQVESKANDDSLKKNETERMREKKQNEDHQELMEIEKSDQRKEEREDNIVGKGETIDHEYKIHEHEEGKSDKLERHEEEEMSGSLGKEKTSNDIEENRGNRAGAETKIRDDGFEEEELAIVVRHREQDKKQSFVGKHTTGKAKENKNQETKSRDDSSIKTQEKERQESHEQKRNYEEQDKKNLGPNYCRNEEDGKEDTEIAEAEGPRKLKGIEKRESTKIVEGHENQDNINELVEEKMNNQEGEDKESMPMEVLAKYEDHEPKGHEGLRKQDKSRELVQQRLRDNHEDEETEKTETKCKDNESRKIHQVKAKETGEEERRKEQERIKGLVEGRTHYRREKEHEDGNSKKVPEIDKEELTEPGRDEKRDEIEEPVDKETSEDDEEELEVEVEDSEEDWEAEVTQEMDSDEDTDKIRQIRRIRLGFRLVGGSTLFMSLIVIVISFIRSKRKIRCYKF